MKFIRFFSFLFLGFLLFGCSDNQKMIPNVDFGGANPDEISDSDVVPDADAGGDSGIGDNSGDSGGNSGGDSGSDSGNSGSTGGDSGSTGGNSGSTGGDSGSDSGDSGSTGGDSGSTGGDSASDSGNSGSTGGDSGSTGGDSSDSGDSGGNSGGDSGAQFCYAQFNGESSFIEVLHNDLLNLSEKWTIEAWIKQEKLASLAPIIRKEYEGGGSFMPISNDTPPYSLAGFYERSSYSGKSKILIEGGFSYKPENVNIIGGSGDDFYQSATVQKEINKKFEESGYQNQWTHVALVKTDRDLNLYISGEKVKTEKNKNETYSNDKNLLFGKNKEGFFNGLIDSIRISNSAIYDGDFPPLRNLTKKEGVTIGLWQFNGDAKDSSGNNLHGKETDIKWAACESEN